MVGMDKQLLAAAQHLDIGVVAGGYLQRVLILSARALALATTS